MTNGLGSYAASTALSINTRKYHGLLVAALHPPGDRTVCLAKLDEEVIVGNDLFSFGANEFIDVIQPKGYLFLKEFSVSPFPTFLFETENIEVKKTIFMPYERTAVVAVYNVKNSGEMDSKMKVYPSMSCRHFQSVVDRSVKQLNFTQTSKPKEVELVFSQPKATLVSRAIKGNFSPNLQWIDKLRYREEEEQKESSLDDCFQPGFFEFTLPRKQEFKFAIASAVTENNGEAITTLNEMGNCIEAIESLLTQELNRKNHLLTQFYGTHQGVTKKDWLSWILLSADSFIVKKGYREFIIAGYYRFEPWGRDSFISLPGLLLVTGRFDDAKKVLLKFSSYSKRGLIPDYIDEKTGVPAYNTVDATLWYINAVWQFLKYTADFKFVKETFWDGLKDIIDNHRKGTKYDIRVNRDGLLEHGPRLTWMDAENDGVAVTPRAGKAVEIQALWYNALRICETLAKKYGEDSLADDYSLMANKAKASFNREFWNNEKQCLFDDVDEHEADQSVRSNQIIAVGLDFTMLEKDRQNLVVDFVMAEFLTPYGLRTLSKSDPRYRGRYFGDWKTRNLSYHNGAIWPWLTGPLTKAYLRTKGQASHQLKFAQETFLFPLFSQQVIQGGLGSISELYEGDLPHAPGGCISQAWSVAELLRAYVEDTLQFRPPHEKEAFNSERA
ncbi:MAG TPA: amylo-alpha-1,6-glucosidase [Candidatus Binatia bacterium]|nr:amylo-alpha-1,6-glucosidase [Candidatus Binatia bacterium]